MCGICGLVNLQKRQWTSEKIDRMTDALLHRGPDAGGTYSDDFISFGHRRLSILDLSDAGRQPMLRGELVLTFNGEIYNYRELRAELVELGEEFSSSTDSEVILAGYHQWGINIFQRLRGMFAIGLWDPRIHTFYLVRDSFGIKPISYHIDRQGTICFASEIKALLKGCSVPIDMNTAALGEYLFFGNALGEKTFFQNVQRVPPGCILEFSREGERSIPFWTPESWSESPLSFFDAVRDLQAHLEDAVHSHLISDVPIGVFLSGGIDSSCITALASKHLGTSCDTFTAIFDEIGDRDERLRAQSVSQLFHTRHHEIEIHGANLEDTLEKLVESHDEPFGDAANIPLYLLCQKLQGSPKVILQGDGGDEIFGGYRRYLWLNALTKMPSLRCLFQAGGGALSHFSRFQRGSRFFRALGSPDSANRMALLLTTETLSDSPFQALSNELQKRLSQTDPFSHYRILEQKFRHLDPLQKMLYVDTQAVLPNTFLEKVDKSTMAHGIEVRVPFLDTRLAQFAMQLPSNYKVRGVQKKYILREALRGILPNQILDAPKAGFGVPYGKWLRGSLNPFMRSVLLDPLNAKLFDQRTVLHLIEEHTSGRADRGYLLWKLLQLALWNHRYRVIG